MIDTPEHPAHCAGAARDAERWAARSGSTPYETFRGAMLGRTPEGQPSTVIVTRQGLGSDGRVWLTFDGAIKTTVVMTNPETVQLGELLDKATGARRAASSPGEDQDQQDGQRCR